MLRRLSKGAQPADPSLAAKAPRLPPTVPVGRVRRALALATGEQADASGSSGIGDTAALKSAGAGLSPMQRLGAAEARLTLTVTVTLTLTTGVRREW